MGICKSNLRDGAESSVGTRKASSRPVSYRIRVQASKKAVFSQAILDEIFRSGNTSSPYWADFCHLCYNILPQTPRIQRVSLQTSTLGEQKADSTDIKNVTEEINDERYLRMLVHHLFHERSNPLELIFNNFANLLSAFITHRNLNLFHCRESIQRFCNALRKVAILLFENLLCELFSTACQRKYAQVTWVLDSLWVNFMELCS